MSTWTHFARFQAESHRGHDPAKQPPEVRPLPPALARAPRHGGLRHRVHDEDVPRTQGARRGQEDHRPLRNHGKATGQEHDATPVLLNHSKLNFIFFFSPDLRHQAVI